MTGPQKEAQRWRQITILAHNSTFMSHTHRERDTSPVFSYQLLFIQLLSLSDPGRFPAVLATVYLHLAPNLTIPVSHLFYPSLVYAHASLTFPVCSRLQCDKKTKQCSVILSALLFKLDYKQQPAHMRPPASVDLSIPKASDNVRKLPTPPRHFFFSSPGNSSTLACTKLYHRRN